MKTHNKPAAAGFTFIEVIVVVGIIGIFLVASFPSILNTMESRNLENATRRIQTYFQQTRNRAVDTKIIHRVRFTRITDTSPAYWTYDMEMFQVDGTWVKAEAAPRKAIPAKFAVTIALPADGDDFIVDFSPVGSVVNFTLNLNSITLQSPKLDRPGQMDQRVLNLFMGGSIQYLKQKS